MPVATRNPFPTNFSPQPHPLMFNWSWGFRDKMNIFSVGWAIQCIFLESRNGGKSIAWTLRQWLGTGLMVHWSLDSMANGAHQTQLRNPRPDYFVGCFFRANSVFSFQWCAFHKKQKSRGDFVLLLIWTLSECPWKQIKVNLKRAYHHNSNILKVINFKSRMGFCLFSCWNR